MSFGTTPSRSGLLLVIQVVDEGVEGEDPLPEPALDPVPFGAATIRGMRSKGRVFSTPGLSL